MKGARSQGANAMPHDSALHQRKQASPPFKFFFGPCLIPAWPVGGVPCGLHKVWPAASKLASVISLGRLAYKN